MSTIIKAVIIDDEADAISNLSALILKYCEGVEIVGTASVVKQAISIIKTTKPDLVFLDIELNRETGFDVLESFSYIDFKVIFVTAYQQYTLKAIKASAIDYLLKPIDIEELQKAIGKVKQLKEQNSFPQLLEAFRKSNNTSGKLVLHTMQGFNIVEIKDILYCKAEGNYIQFFCIDDVNYLITKKLKEYENQLIEHDFFRIHHGYLVNLRMVKSFIKTDGGTVVMTDGTNLPVSTRKKEAFLNRIEALNR